MKFSSKIKRSLIVFSILLTLVAGLAFSPDYFEISKNLDIFNAVYRELNVSYVDGTKPGQLMKTGIDAMLNSLDPYTVYYTENDIEDYRYMTTGEYGGIGASVVDMDGKIIITDPFEGFAAYKAGLRGGDQIVEVNGINVLGKKTDDISTLLKGTAGTTLTLKVLKPGEKVSVPVNLTREEIKNKAVPYSGTLPNSETGYIKLNAFTENCSGEVKEALMDLKNKGCKNLVLDLRGNLGGILNEAVNIVNFFIDKGQEVVFTKGKVQEWDRTYLSVNNPIDTQIPLVVLVDENSASASEIVCGALQDFDRAVIVGKRTYGKGLVQQTKQLIYNAQIKVTVAKYHIPSGRCVQALDYSNKDADGRVEKVPDSLITAFKTRGGRIVYDGAGVMPDVKTKEEKYPAVLISLVNKHHIFNYATDFVLKHKVIDTPKNFALSDADYTEFTNFLKDKEYNYVSTEETELAEFKKNVERVNGFDAIKNEYEALANKLKNDKKDDLIKHKAQIKKYLEDEIVGRYYFQKGRLEYGLKHDDDVDEALKIVNDAGRIKTILTTIDKPQKPFNAKKKF